MHLFVQKLWHRVASVPLTQAGPEGTCSYIGAFSNLLHCGNNLVSNAKESKDTRRGLSVFWFTRTLLARIRSPFGDKTINLSLSLSHFPSASLCVSVDTKTGMCSFFSFSQSVLLSTRTTPANVHVKEKYDQLCCCCCTSALFMASYKSLIQS